MQRLGDPHRDRRLGFVLEAQQQGELENRSTRAAEQPRRARAHRGVLVLERRNENGTRVFAFEQIAFGSLLDAFVGLGETEHHVGVLLKLPLLHVGQADYRPAAELLQLLDARQQLQRWQRWHLRVGALRLAAARGENRHEDGERRQGSHCHSNLRSSSNVLRGSRSLHIGVSRYHIRTVTAVAPAGAATRTSCFLPAGNCVFSPGSSR